MNKILIYLICLISVYKSLALDDSLTTLDIKIAENCEIGATSTDHLLFDYQIKFSNGSLATGLKQGEAFSYVLLEEFDTIPLKMNMVGMCENSTKRFVFRSAKDADLSPIIVKRSTKEIFKNLEESISIDLTLHHITTQKDYEIFHFFNIGNSSKVMDMVWDHVGVNAVDAWGQSPLLIAVNNKDIPVISGLLNTRRPSVNVNFIKASGFTALHYAVQKHPSQDILKALLRRGADPNIFILQEGSYGNTPLHLACLLEKPKHARILLEYGANPIALNQYNMSPLQMLPADSLMSTKNMFKKMFDTAMKGKHTSPNPNFLNKNNEL